jgi:hypothetical protein
VTKQVCSGPRLPYIEATIDGGGQKNKVMRGDNPSAATRASGAARRTANVNQIPPAKELEPCSLGLSRLPVPLPGLPYTVCHRRRCTAAR